MYWFRLWWVSVVLLAAIAAAAWWHLDQVTQEPWLTIAAPLDAPNPLPVYDQFVVTQTIQAPGSALVTSMQIPLMIPTNTPVEPLHVKLRRGEKTVAAWHYLPPAEDATPNTIITAELPLTPPQLLDGTIEVIFSTPHVTAEHAGRALAVLVETAGDIFPAGSYRIADNEKHGDIGLTFISAVRGWHYLEEAWQQDAWNVATKTMLAVCGLILVWNVPYILARNGGHTTAGTTAQIL